MFNSFISLRMSFLSVFFSPNALLVKRGPLNCMARQCSPLRRKFMQCPIINPALSILVKHLGQGQKVSNFSAFH